MRNILKRRIYYWNLNNLTDAWIELVKSKLWIQSEEVILKSIKKNIWPPKLIIINECFESLQYYICKLSYEGKYKDALNLISTVAHSSLLKFLAINKITITSGMIPGKDNQVLLTQEDKISMFKITNFFNLDKQKQIDVLQVRVFTEKKDLYIWNIKERVLQTQLCFLLDPLYEGNFSEHIYGGRKGRNLFQVIGFISKIFNNAIKDSLNIVLFNLSFCFDQILHDKLLVNFQLPFLWESLVLKWLKPFLWDGFTLNYINKVDSGLIAGSWFFLIIRNFIINSCFFKIYNKLSSKFNFSIANDIKPFYKNTLGGTLLNTCHILNYMEDIILITNNKFELVYFIQKIKASFKKWNIFLVKQKSIFLKSDLNRKITFEYLGFKWTYIPTFKIRSDSVLLDKKILTENVLSKVDGKLLLNPNPNLFCLLKENLRKKINTLSKNDFVDVICMCNKILLLWSKYFSWSDTFNKLVRLDHFLYKKFKINLLTKFRYRGKVRNKWVAFKFFLCRTKKSKDVIVFSCYKKRWHIHCKFVNNTYGKKNIIFLILATKIYKLNPISINVLPFTLRYSPYYLARIQYSRYKSRILKSRTNFVN